MSAKIVLSGHLANYAERFLNDKEINGRDANKIKEVVDSVKLATGNEGMSQDDPDRIILSALIAERHVADDPEFVICTACLRVTPKKFALCLTCAGILCSHGEIIGDRPGEKAERSDEDEAGLDEEEREARDEELRKAAEAAFNAMGTDDPHMDDDEDVEMTEAAENEDEDMGDTPAAGDTAMFGDDVDYSPDDSEGEEFAQGLKEGAVNDEHKEEDEREEVINPEFGHLTREFPMWA